MLGQPNVRHDDFRPHYLRNVKFLTDITFSRAKKFISRFCFVVGADHRSLFIKKPATCSGFIVEAELNPLSS